MDKGVARSRLFRPIESLDPGDLGGAHRLFVAFEGRGGAHREVDRVEELLGPEATRKVAGKIDLVVGVGFVRQGVELVGARGANRADGMAEIESSFHKIGGEGVEQGGIDRRIRRAEVINGINDAASHEVEPDPVRLDPGKERVLRRGEPLPESGEAFLVDRESRGLSEELRRGSLAAAGVLEITFLDELHDLLADEVIFVIRVKALVLFDVVVHPVEDGGELVILVHRPLLEGVVVALRAVHADAEEDLGDGLGAVFGRA